MPCELAVELTKLGDCLGSLDVSGVDPVDVDEVLVATERCRRALGALDARLHSIVASTRSVRRDRLRTNLKLSTGEADRRSRVADTVSELPIADEALAAGAVSETHIEALAAARQIAGENLGTDHVQRLLADAAAMPADQFRTHATETARRLCLDDGEAHHDNLRRRRSLRWWRTHDGMTRLAGDLDPDSSAILTKAVERELHARWHRNNPTGHTTATTDSPADTIDARRLDALVALVANPNANANANANDSARQSARSGSDVGILIDYETLRNGLHATSICQYDTGDPIPPSVARTLACDADIYPALIGSAGEVLDLGRSTRSPSRAQRRALAIRDRTCVHPACNAPPAWCDAHHVIAWWEPRRGPTHIDNLVLLCRHHHTQLHRGAWALDPAIVQRAERTLTARGRPTSDEPP